MDNLLLCNDCNWTGKQEDCIREYRGVQGTEGDVELHLQCPQCGSESLIELTGEGSRLLEPALAF